MLTLLVSPFIIIFFVILAGYGYNQGVIQTWYQGLKKPAGNPPNWVFSLIWLILYLLIAGAWCWQAQLFIDGKISGKKFDLISILFYINLILNLCWTIVFFGRQSIMGGLVVLPLLIISTAGVMWAIGVHGSMYMLIPYLLWLIYALYLNVEFYILNK